MGSKPARNADVVHQGCLLWAKADIPTLSVALFPRQLESIRRECLDRLIVLGELKAA